MHYNKYIFSTKILAAFLTTFHEEIVGVLLPWMLVVWISDPQLYMDLILGFQEPQLYACPLLKSDCYITTCSVIFIIL